MQNHLRFNVVLLTACHPCCTSLMIQRVQRPFVLPFVSQHKLAGCASAGRLPASPRAIIYLPGSRTSSRVR